MGLFQASILNKYLNILDKKELSKAYKKFTAHFHHQVIQANIRKGKEEQYQGEFLIDLFVNILGYTKHPNQKYNLTTEYKNVKDSKKADGAIIINNEVKAVIELKGTNTTDLNSVETQAFGYKNNQPDCIYIITSNYEKLRFYIDNAIEHIEFNLFTLTEDEFAVLYLCLAFSSLSKGIPKKIKEESVSKEDTITKQLYKDYSVFKKELYINLVKRNPKIKKIELYKKSQKLLDRFLFLFFAEDRQLLAPNSVRSILKKWQQLKDLDQDKSLYENFQEFFGHLNKGFKGNLYEVYAYNGGLFKPDELLDVVKIDDDLLYRHTFKLSEYNFSSEVDVNILGHIFENSLNELDEIKAELEGIEIEKSNSKRKKDGVYYTPKYITKYIIDNTIGKLCNEKKLEFQIKESDYIIDKKRQKATQKALFNKLTTYREWLLKLTICDPACGSGAFLNQALDFLIAEHKNIDELQAKLFGDRFILSDVENSILENNLFGVDLNEESVEIAKLSLWLRTAQPNRKLNDLSNNIKCGNSLTDDRKVDKEKAFNWEKEFAHVFENGRFDVVIGNPPYISTKDMHRHGLKEQIKHWNKKFESAKSGNYDIYILFVEQGLKLLKKEGIMSFIIPNKFLIATYSGHILKLINDEYLFKEIVDYSHVNVFPDASVYPVIITLENKKGNSELTDRIIVEQGALERFGLKRSWNYIKLKYTDSLDKKSDAIIEKLQNTLDSVNSNLTFEPGINGFQFTNYSTCVSDGAESEDAKKLITTGSIDPHIFTNSVTRFKGKDYEQAYINYNSEIISEGKWELFCKPKIMVAGMTKKIEAALDLVGQNAPAVSVYSICGKPNVLKQLIIIINSTLINWFFKHKFSDKHLAGGYISVNNLLLQQIPFKVFKNPKEANKLSEDAEELHLMLQDSTSQFQRTIKRRFELDSLPKKLQDWYFLSYSEFVNELKKLKVKLSVSDEAEWEQYFIKEQIKTKEIASNIEKNHKEIDRIVYALYKITPEEVKLIEQP